MPHWFPSTLLSPKSRMIGIARGLSLAGKFLRSFGMALGGGLDYRLNEAAAVRIIQVDYTMFRANGDKLQGVRLGGGVVFLLGKKK